MGFGKFGLRFALQGKDAADAGIGSVLPMHDCAVLQRARQYADKAELAAMAGVIRLEHLQDRVMARA